MSYAGSGPLQAAVFDALSADASVAAVVGSAIYDAEPAGNLPPLFVRLGSETVRDASDVSGAGALHRFTVSVVSLQPGFANAKQAASAICDALQDAALPLSRGRLVSLRFERANARRIDSGSARQIDLRFAALVQGD
ncbi:hypothetical protein BOO69_10625 [Sulfitobacter alexandrii]|uniref:DUF3168 domain-containing protein n=1 Tax=Sulfitobacter alexandrii TaxID=1917485 RepID=A0A1J0WHL6_9RHOB|nr:DUF3168 domain-containing protein [Sulfitobacter alexandrii]APE43817.1 hypothetical protein BOO69_10625 [Sulfitobacter alexandrii]